MRRIYFVTGTDTGVGKTVLAALLVRRLRADGRTVVALKPVSTGGREDAQQLRDAVDGAMSLDEINPWHYRAPLAPSLAARREGKRLRLREVIAWLKESVRSCEAAVVEGAGGLLTPLGQDFNARDLIAALEATPLLVCPNRLGAVNQTLLTLHALPRAAAARSHVVLMTPERPDASTASNRSLLGEFIGPRRISALPWLRDPFAAAASGHPAVRHALRRLTHSVSPRG